MSTSENGTLSRAKLDLNSGISIKRITINDPSQLPRDFATTPGGTFFSTTPGGTRIIYDRAFLLSRKESPLCKSPPANLPFIPEVTLIPPKENNNNESHVANQNPKDVNKAKKEPGDMQFEMDI